ncbi:hypothetical protein [Burkholderia arboris]|uniref:hypothetical protein n=1 Tax=Burkholderia arboris TaxID=488730 RepID=UPI0015831FB1|nr:hypothetical protein [Burkholderia arboris]
MPGGTAIVEPDAAARLEEALEACRWPAHQGHMGVSALLPTSVSVTAINKIDRHDENYAFSLQVAVMHSCVVLTHL